MAKTATTTETARIAAVGTLINQAGKAAASMLAKVREAAEKAAAQLDPAKPIGERIADVVSLYADDFKAVDHNVKALFVDALTLHAAAQTPVSVKVGKDDQHVTAAEAVTMSKHAMRDAAKQVRDAHGIGRKSGGGRKAAPAAKAEAAEAAVGLASEVDKFSQWLDALPDYLSDAVYHPRIVAALIEAGYTLGKAAKGRTVKGAASA